MINTFHQIDEKQKNATLFDVLVVFILITSFVSISSLALNVFNVHRSIILAAILTLSIFWMRNNSWKIDFRINKNNHLLPILLLLLVGLLFRSEPYHYIAGGQDEGVYVNMSKYYENYGKIFIIDELRKKLPDELVGVYDSANLTIERRKNIRVEGQKEGDYLPGVYVKDLKNSEYVFQFYQLHPLWMSIFGTLFGDINRIYSLVFFSLLSIVAFYLLAFEFTKNKFTAFGAASLLAINPLHAFFSKFPVTEVVALSFTTLSFYYLLKYYNSAKNEDYCPVNLILSSLLITSMFFTRISGFMYIPFFYLILIMVQLYISNQTVKMHLKLYVFSVFFLYGISVWYGLVYSFPYSNDIYRISFTKIFGGEWQTKLLLLIGSLALFYLVVLYTSKTNYSNTLKIYLSGFRRVIPYLFLIVLSLGLYKVFQLGFTEKYFGDKWLDLRWHLVGIRWGAFLYWSVFVVFEYLSPFIFLVFGYILFSQVKTNDTARTMLVLFILLFFVHISLLQWIIPYQYYYSRYLLSEALPAIMLFTIISLDEMVKFKKIAYLLIGCSAIYMMFFTSTQFKGKEMQGFHSSLSELKKHIGKDDILILDKRTLHTAGEIKTALNFYFDYNVLTVKPKDRERFLDYFCGRNKDVYFFNSHQNSEFLEPLKAVQVNAEIFEHVNHIPMDIVQISKQYYLSRLPSTDYNLKKMQGSYTLYERGSALGGMINFHDDGLWTKEKSSLTNIDIVVDHNKFLVLETLGYNPLRNNLSELELKVKANGCILPFVKQGQNKYYFTLPNIHKISDLDILCNAFVPKEMGINQDKRKLGIDVKSIKLVEEIAQ